MIHTIEYDFRCDVKKYKCHCIHKNDDVVMQWCYCWRNVKLRILFKIVRWDVSRLIFVYDLFLLKFLCFISNVIIKNQYKEQYIIYQFDNLWIYNNLKFCKQILNENDFEFLWFKVDVFDNNDHEFCMIILKISILLFTFIKFNVNFNHWEKKVIMNI